MDVTGLIILVGIILAAVIPFIVIGTFIRHSRLVADRNYLDSKNVSFQVMLTWKENKIKELESRSSPAFVLPIPKPEQVVRTMDDKPDLPAQVAQSPAAAISWKEPVGSEPELASVDGLLEMEFKTKSTGPLQFTPPRIESMDEAEMPDMEFVQRLNANRRDPNHGKVIPFPGPSSSLENKQHMVSLFVEEDEALEQVEMELEIEERHEYVWTEGSHFLHFRIIDHHGQDLAMCEIVGNGGKTMLQHARIEDLLNGDEFMASIFIRKGSGKEVQKLWTVPQQKDLLIEAEG